MDIKRMVKRRKDTGFTLIELMIVIAVIGILAVVLVPKVGNVKTAAKSAGVDTNIRAVQAYAQSKINYWKTLPETGLQTAIQNDISGALGSNGSDPLVNPISREADALSLSTVPASPTKGSIYVEVPDTQANLTLNGIKLTGIDGNNAVSSPTLVKP